MKVHTLSIRRGPSRCYIPGLDSKCRLHCAVTQKSLVVTNESFARICRFFTYSLQQQQKNNKNYQLITKKDRCRQMFQYPSQSTSEKIKNFSIRKNPHDWELGNGTYSRQRKVDLLSSRQLRKLASLNSLQRKLLRMMVQAIEILPELAEGDQQSTIEIVPLCRCYEIRNKLNNQW